MWATIEHWDTQNFLTIPIDTTLFKDNREEKLIDLESYAYTEPCYDVVSWIQALYKQNERGFVNSPFEFQ